MEQETVFYGGIIAIATLGLLLVVLCVLCKYIVNSKKARKWNIFRIISNESTKERPYCKTPRHGKVNFNYWPLIFFCLLKHLAIQNSKALLEW